MIRLSKTARVDQHRPMHLAISISVCVCIVLLPAITARAHTNLVSTNFPAPYNSEPDSTAAPPSAAEAVRRIQLPEGFKASVFAAEPDVQNPIALAWDARGRLWVAENYTYAERAKKFERALRDRVIIFEDTDHDGRQDRRTVFTDEVQMLTSVEVGLGGVWMLCPPQLLFVPDRDGDDRPDGAPTVVLDGFTVAAESHHTFANGLRWGPDGWLYGRCGASSPGEVGRPGAAAAARVPLRGGMWRYHPGRQVFEALSHGTTNPWGHDWNEHGELFYINTVNGHLWHLLPGMHFVRPHTIDPNPRVYEAIDHHADHWHFDTGRGWMNSRDGQADAYGGGHAHVGMTIYQGDNWPADYRGRLLTLNLHGRRANVERLERSGSGYVGRHQGDILQSGDPWFRGMEISTGPDGGVYLLDWSDTGECHESTGVHRTSGRIYKVAHGVPRVRPALASTPVVTALVDALADTNAWVARQAQQQLQAKLYRGESMSTAGQLLRERCDRASSVELRLRYLWALNAIGQVDPAYLRAQLQSSNEHVRAWGIRLLTDAWPIDDVISRRPAGDSTTHPDPATFEPLVTLAGKDPSALVRLVLASTLQRLPVSLRPKLAAGLVSHAEDADDHNLPALIWFGLIPVAETDPAALAGLGASSRMPRILRWTARRLTEENEKNPGPLNRLLSAAGNRPDADQGALLTGLAEGFNGWRKATAPAVWPEWSSQLAAGTNLAAKAMARELSVLFGDGRALDELRRIALDSTADLEARRVALQAIIDARAPEARRLCEQLLKVRFLNTTAVRGLAAYNDPALGEALAQSYRSFHPSERPALLETLASRPTFAAALLEEMAEGRIPREDLTPFLARQIRSFSQPALRQQLAKAWGEIQESGPEKRERIENLRRKLSPAVLAKADMGHGRALFNTACAACHRLYGQGGDIGPDLTGAGRDNLDYLLENIVDPSAVVSADFKVTIVTLKDERVFNGLVQARTTRTLTLKLMNNTVTLENTDIEEARPSELSLMPEGLFDAWPDEHIRDLLGYLMHPVQVPLPASH